jgi:hypothetical protein
VASRSDERSAAPAPGWLTRWFTIVGTLTSTVGRWRRIRSKSTSGVQRSGKSTDRAPTENGNRRLVPSAYPKKSLGTDIVMSSSVRPSVPWP